MLRKNFRTIRTRGVTLTKEQMENYRIKRIFNTVGDPEYLNDEDAEDILRNNIEQGEFCLLETASDEKLYIISLITFADIWSRNVFALMQKDYYETYPDLLTLYN